MPHRGHNLGRRSHPEFKVRCGRLCDFEDPPRYRRRRSLAVFCLEERARVSEPFQDAFRVIIHSKVHLPKMLSKEACRPVPQERREDT